MLNLNKGRISAGMCVAVCAMVGATFADDPIVLVSDLAPTNSNPQSMAALGDAVCFSATDETSGFEVYFSDGDGPGTLRLMDINVGSGSSSPFSFTPLNGRLYFTANPSFASRCVYSTDGTEAGTVLEYTPPAYSLTGGAGSLFAVGDTLIAMVSIRGSSGPGDDPRLARRDPVTGAWSIIATFTDMNQGSLTKGMALKNKLYFLLEKGTSGPRYFASINKDGTGFTNYGAIAGVSPTIQFLGTSGTRILVGYKPFATPTSLWSLDTTTDTLTQITGLQPSLNASANDLFEQPNLSAAALGGYLYFGANGADGTGVELWRSDGTQSGTARYADINTGAANSSPSWFATVGDRVYFSATTAAEGNEVWSTNGDGSAPVLLSGLIAPGTENATPTRLLALSNSHLVFSATNTTTGRELWVSDGTEAGTVMVEDLNPGAASSDPTFITRAGPNVFFSATTATTGRELYRVPVSAIDPSPSDVANFNTWSLME